VRASAQERLDLAIAEENRDFCAKFGVRAGTSGCLACANELEVIPRKQVDRDRGRDWFALEHRSFITIPRFFEHDQPRWRVAMLSGSVSSRLAAGQEWVCLL
jgi:hypothetical protein